MTIGISPLVPTSLDRDVERGNPREPWLDKTGKRVERDENDQERRLDEVEDAVPPLAPNK